MSNRLRSDDHPTRHIRRRVAIGPALPVDTPDDGPPPEGCLLKDGQTDERFASVSDDETIRRERGIARALRATAWWRRKKANGRCHYCGGHFKPADLTMDHLVPLVRGGRSVRANLVPCCKPCNNDKKSRLALEWNPTNPPLAPERSPAPS